MLTCVDRGTSQRWTVYHTSGSRFEYSFTIQNSPRSQYVRPTNQYTFTLITADRNNFKSTFSTQFVERLSRIECAGAESDEFTVRIAGITIYNR